MISPSRLFDAIVTSPLQACRRWAQHPLVPEGEDRRLPGVPDGVPVLEPDNADPEGRAPEADDEKDQEAEELSAHAFR